ncbi:HAD family hydrolase [Saliterribacillus persicus]|uniref:Putative hydrolase of the HAD superfamily n=1 Tax=Saliterribacillus persicus TaxID=930114 RepID=A0A368XNP4_9BACI|nr:hypothetical protein [Saliterribacillus persicus]RCW69632.1 putative hydrolase of the HAD superfamily [Saliterribacillus persicus]
MNKEIALVLDVGGVLAKNLDQFWIDVSTKSSINYTEIRSQYKVEINDSLWTGACTIDRFFSWLSSITSLSIIDLEETLKSCLTELPAIRYLPEWSKFASVHILSNHRKEWLENMLHPYQSYISSQTISSEVGALKPDEIIFQKAQMNFPNANIILFVDDKNTNLATAKSLGWKTIEADEKQNWIYLVNNALKKDS